MIPTKEQRIENERKRVQLIIERDGLQAALDFARRGIPTYIAAALERCLMDGSVAYYRQFLKENGCEVVEKYGQ